MKKKHGEYKQAFFEIEEIVVNKIRTQFAVFGCCNVLFERNNGCDKTTDNGFISGISN